MNTKLTIRDIHSDEFGSLGKLLIDVYSQLDGFPTQAEQPGYYDMLRDIGRFTEKPSTKVLVAVSPEARLLGGVVYFGDMAQYGSGGIATTVPDAAGFRLLAVAPDSRGLGVGKALTEACIELAMSQARAEVVLHTTKAMQVAWTMYEKLGFARSTELDFIQGALPVFGFRRRLVG